MGRVLYCAALAALMAYLLLLAHVRVDPAVARHLNHPFAKMFALGAVLTTSLLDEPLSVLMAVAFIATSAEVNESLFHISQL